MEECLIPADNEKNHYRRGLWNCREHLYFLGTRGVGSCDVDFSPKISSL